MIDIGIRQRIGSIDALRGLVMFVMIFVNDLAGVPEEIVPAWLRHHDSSSSGMTFVDLVFPAFIFVVGMSVPLALDRRPDRVLGRVFSRAATLIVLGVMMYNDAPDPARMGMSEALYMVLMLGAGILFCTTVRVLRVAGLAGLLALAFVYTTKKGAHVVNLDPFSIKTGWWGILGLIGWSYLVAALVYLLVRHHRHKRVALFGAVVLLLCLYPIGKIGPFKVGELAAHSAIAVAGVLFVTSLTVRSALVFIAGSAAGALLLQQFWGISKVHATPPWCLWACAVTAALWLVLHRVPAGILAVAGGNVLLAYLLSETFVPLRELAGISEWYDGLGSTPAAGIARSLAVAVLVLAASIGLNKVGFRLRA
ncbi:hypothetical protein Lesp02_37590 [Lentzea sp. NBRC 105346]|uniref:DUF5009 domain-containing protein n=1 Tax=Lentzea sp. NBRC 105346 TaxID=3032205 RepID=UPI0024A4981F|nr:DUF5009 domain-containing protein [Lentzea sp. NBRC 105346]GLZ31571.1 hypothetical protein Lesp02_37590 [Lentzea sp. NBRC 105346]